MNSSLNIKPFDRCLHDVPYPERAQSCYSGNPLSMYIA
jgi:hypothetical protein